MKKLLLSTLVAVMCLAFGSTAFAAASTVGPAFSDIAGNEAEFELTALGALGIYTGDAGLGGAVTPDEPITRAQFCKVVVAAMGRSTTAAGLAGLQPTFSDGASIPTWAWGYVNVAVYMGVINGYADGSFKANNPVTYAEVVTMLIRAISGHAAMVGPGVWPYNFLFYGVDNDFTGGVDVGFANLPATRGDVARMLFATMQIDKLNAKGEVQEDTAILFGRLDTGILTSFSLDGNTSSLGGLAAKVYVAGAADLQSLMQIHVVGVENADGKIVAIAKDEDATTVSGVFAKCDVGTGTDTKNYIYLKDGTKVEYIPAPGAGHPEWALNGDPAFVPGATELDPPVRDWQIDGLTDNLAVGDQLVVTTNEDGVAVFVTATRFAPLDYVADNGVTKSSVDPDGTKHDTVVDPEHGASFEVPATCAVTVNGATADRNSLAGFDVIAVALNLAGKAVVLDAHREVIEGTVTGTTTTYGAGTTTERVNITLKAGGSKTYTINSTGYVALPMKDDVVKYGLDAEGKLFVPVGYKGVTPFVMVKSFVVNGDGTATATCDVRGAEVTYKVDNLAIDANLDGTNDTFLRTIMQTAAEDGSLLWIEVNTATGTIVDVAEISFGGTQWYVLANSGGALTLGDNPDTPANYLFSPADAGITVYKSTDDGFVYMENSALTVTSGWYLEGNISTTSYGFEGDADDLESIDANLLWQWVEVPIS